LNLEEPNSKLESPSKYPTGHIATQESEIADPTDKQETDQACDQKIPKKKGRPKKLKGYAYTSTIFKPIVIEIDKAKLGNGYRRIVGQENRHRAYLDRKYRVQ
jgi:hypothetical protein